MNQSSTYLQIPPRTTTIDPLKAIVDADDFNIIQNYDMQQKQLDRSEKKKKKKKRERRSKDDNHERNFICGCGKSYLSYAALYTHAKTKHDGVFPEGTTTLNKKKQGRPKKEEWCASKLNSAYQKTYDFNKDFQHYLEMIPQGRDDKENTIKNIISSFPCELFREQKFYEKILLNINTINQELINNFGNTYLNQIEIIMFDIKNLRELNCNEVLALFLVYIFRFVSDEFFKDIVFFIVSYRIMLNEKGWEVCSQFNDGFRFNTDEEFCESQNAEFIPELANKFILEYFIECLGQRKVLAQDKQLNFFGLEQFNLLRVVLFMKHFCSWLLIHKFTKGKIDLCKDSYDKDQLIKLQFKMNSLLRKRKVKECLSLQMVQNDNQILHTKKSLNLFGEVVENHHKQLQKLKILFSDLDFQMVENSFKDNEYDILQTIQCLNQEKNKLKFLEKKREENFRKDCIQLMFQCQNFDQALQVIRYFKKHVQDNQVIYNSKEFKKKHAENYLLKRGLKSQIQKTAKIKNNSQKKLEEIRCKQIELEIESAKVSHLFEKLTNAQNKKTIDIRKDIYQLIFLQINGKKSKQYF